MKAEMLQRGLHGSRRRYAPPHHEVCSPAAAARKQKISKSFQSDLPGPALREKRIPFARDPNQSYKSRHPGPQEGRIAIVTDVGPGCGGRESAGRVT